MAKKKVSYINFYELFKNGGFFTTDEEGNEVLDADKVKSEIGITASAAQGFIEGYNNPLRGKNYQAVIDYFELDIAQTRAFLRWRAEKWQEWEDAGYPEEGPTAEVKDEDYNGEYYEEELAALEPSEEDEELEEGDDFSEEAEGSEETEESEEEVAEESDEFDDENSNDEDEFTL